MRRNRDVRGQVAVVTGASSGVGWQTALTLADAGMKVCLSARRGEVLERLQDELRARGAETLVCSGDITREEDVHHLIDACVERFGRVDVLVNVPGVQRFARFEDYAWEEIARIMDVNFFGYLRLTRAALPHFRRQGTGHVVNILSVFAEMGFPLFSIYAASKHALLGWADTLRLELWGSGIDVSNVLLPSMATPFYDVASTELGKAPRPPFPVYSAEFAASAVLRCIRSPDPHQVPALLQGKLALAARRIIPSVVDAVLARFGPRMVTGRRRVDRGEGNLFAPPPLAGPAGTARVTPVWARQVMNACALGGLTAAGAACVLAAARAFTFTRGSPSTPAWRAALPRTAR